MGDPVAALEAEAARTGALLAGLGPGDWVRPTRCPPLDLRELAVHALRGAYRLAELTAGPPVDDEPQLDAVTYYRYDPAEVGSGVVARAQAEAGTRPAGGVAEEWAAAWRDGIAAVRGRIDADPVVASPYGTIRLREYVRTRCVEVTIHAMDLRDALGLAPDPSPEGLEAACDVLRGLLGTDLRPMGVGDLRFALAGTGRAALDDAERTMLGPLADSFPLLQ